jgi:hypothetical protein
MMSACRLKHVEVKNKILEKSEKNASSWLKTRNSELIFGVKRCADRKKKLHSSNQRR